MKGKNIMALDHRISDAGARLRATIKHSKPDAKYRIALLATVIGFLVANMSWVMLYRFGQPIDIDEAAYLRVSVLDAYAFLHGGILAWLKSVETASSTGPLTPGITSVFGVLMGPGVASGLMSMVVITALAVVMTYYLAKAVARDRAVAVFAAVLLATTPVVIRETRSYHYAMPAMAAAVFALFALIQSKKFSSAAWSAAFGAGVALMVLARTMTVAFVPGLLLPGLVIIVTQHERRSVRIRNFALSCASVLFVAATWSAGSWELAYRYLIGWGYGAKSLEYGSSGSPMSLAEWFGMVRVILGEMQAVHFGVVAIGLGLLAAYAFRRLRNSRIQDAAMAVIASPLFPMTFFVLEALFALRSSRNVGSYFQAPLLPALFVLTSFGFSRILRGRFVAVATTIGVILFSLSIVMYPSTSAIATPFEVRLPFVGAVPVTDGRSGTAIYEDGQGYGGPDDVVPISAAQAAQWGAMQRLVGERLAAEGAGSELVAFGFRHSILNVNSVNLFYATSDGATVPMVMADPVTIGDSVHGYAQWLTSGEASAACLLVTASGSGGEFQPPVTSVYVEGAARLSNFTRVFSVDLPDGRQLHIWRRACR